MKGLIAGVVIVVALGAGAFAYRYEIEKPQEMYTAPATATSTACAQDAQVCPDGSAVGRTGPDCSFATCPPPNISFMIGSSTLAYVEPSGYNRGSTNSNDASVIATYLQTGTTTDAASTITAYAYGIPQGETPGQVMFDKTVFNPSGLQATSTASFRNVTEGNNVFSEVTTETFNGNVETSYYLTTTNYVFRFDVTERGVPNWNDPSLDPDTLPAHETLLQLLATLQLTNS